MNAPAAVVRVALFGAGGRMGQAVLEAARNYSGVQIGAAIVRPGHVPDTSPYPGLVYSDNLEQVLPSNNVVLDFSSLAATPTAVAGCVAAGKPLVTGVTGVDAAVRAELAAASRRIAVLAAPNMSLGANLLIVLAAAAAAALGPQFDLDITDIHHRGKRDAPSGTALALGVAVAKARGLKPEDSVEYGPGSDNGTRRPGSIRYTSLRAGNVVGEHRVLFAGPAESLELSHRAASRSAFALGALAACRWIVQQPAGLYSMADVLHLDGLTR